METMTLHFCAEREREGGGGEAKEKEKNAEEVKRVTLFR